MGAPRVRFHQFRRPFWLRSEVRKPQNVDPRANHWAPDAMENKTGVWVRTVPYKAPITVPGIAVLD